MGAGLGIPEVFISLLHRTTLFTWDAETRRVTLGIRGRLRRRFIRVAGWLRAAAELAPTGEFNEQLYMISFFDILTGDLGRNGPESPMLMSRHCGGGGGDHEVRSTHRVLTQRRTAVGA